jgi:hypothetical protein
VHREVLSSKCFDNGGSNRSSRTLGNFNFSAQGVVIKNWRGTGIALNLRGEATKKMERRAKNLKFSFLPKCSHRPLPSYLEGPYIYYLNNLHIFPKKTRREYYQCTFIAMLVL